MAPSKTAGARYRPQVEKPMKKKAPAGPRRNYFPDVPTEVISHIAKILPTTRDVMNFELASKQIYSAMRSGAARVWQARLTRECLANNLFVPSFDCLDNPQAFKDACTSAHILADKYRHYSMTATAGETPEIESSFRYLALGDGGIDEHMKELMKSKGVKYKPSAGILGAQIVPGGRFVVVLQPGFVTMWDMKDVDAELDTGIPTLCLVHPVHNQSIKIVYLTVEEGRSIQVLLATNKPKEAKLSKEKGKNTSKSAKDEEHTYYALEIRQEEEPESSEVDLREVNWNQEEDESGEEASSEEKSSKKKTSEPKQKKTSEPKPKKSKSSKFVAQGSHLTLAFPHDFEEEGMRPLGILEGKVLWVAREVEYHEEKNLDIVYATIVLWDYKNKKISLWKATGGIRTTQTEYFICDKNQFCMATFDAILPMSIPDFASVPPSNKVRFFRNEALSLKLQLLSKDSISKSAANIRYFHYVALDNTSSPNDETIRFKKYSGGIYNETRAKNQLRGKYWSTHTLSFAGARNPETEAPKLKRLKSSRSSSTKLSKAITTSHEAGMELKFLEAPDLTSRARSSDGGQIFAIDFTRKARNDKHITEGLISLRRWIPEEADIHAKVHPLRNKTCAPYLRLAASSLAQEDVRKLFHLSFCPASGKAVTVWRHKDSETGKGEVTKLKLHVV